MVEQRLRFVGLNVAWLLGTLLVFVSLGAFDVGRFLVVGVVGFFLTAELTATYGVESAWRWRVRAVGVLWVLVFGAVVVMNVARIISEI
ncbi:hypothetical protein [Halocalculus aciditolerans]|uniref:Uncharacterized protein n=1 Tax=Halocalculus aciditolerans TaxID=1383812 RepID=A0A830FHA7_9EURY|nr:hypothetical protein [Halocalculus aciditolerans]GGL55883.1 hypothetical protein GCM10009039_12570 [Halocalculus aciditolerans]